MQENPTFLLSESGYPGFEDVQDVIFSENLRRDETENVFLFFFATLREINV